MAKYLLTGASGFVCGHLVDYLDSLQEPAQILGIDLTEPQLLNKTYNSVQVEIEIVDMLDEEAIRRILRRFEPDYIVHLAAFSSVGYSWKDPVACFSNNTNIFLNLVDAIRLNHIPCRVLSVGSSEQYGIAEANDLPLTESHTLRPISPYAVARVAQESCAKLYQGAYGLDIVMTRSFNHIGPGQRDAFVVSSFARQLVNIRSGRNPDGEIHVGNVNVTRDFVDVRDVVAAYDLIVRQAPAGEVYNVCSGRGTTIIEVIRRMAEILKIDFTLVVDESRIRPTDIPVVIGSYQKLYHELGWQPKIDIDRSLHDLLVYWEGQ